MTTVATLQAEGMKSPAGFGVSVITDAAASGGKALRIDSAVSVTGTVTLSAPIASLTLRAHTDGTTANMILSVDGVPFPQTGVTRASWANYVYGRALAAGKHVVSVRFVNPQTCNLYLDSLAFTAPVTPPQRGVLRPAYLTGYGWPDNDPPNSAAIAHPTATRPHAGGTGTYADPTTMAVGYSETGTDLAYGTIIYVPALRRYFRVEDICGACHDTPRPAGTDIWLDCWVGGEGKTAAYVDGITASLTGKHAVIQNPPSNYAVAPGELADGRATRVTLYGDTPVFV